MLSVNFTAKRFEVLDSIRDGGSVDLIEHASELVEAIKTMYRVNYSDSRRNIDGYELMYIPTPKQDNGLVHVCHIFAANQFEFKSFIYVFEILRCNDFCFISLNPRPFFV